MGFTKLGQYFLTVLFVFLLAACGETDKKQSNANHLSRAKAYQEQGQYKAAMIEYKNAVKKAGDDNSALVKYADMLNRLGRYSVALGMLEQVSGEKDERYFIELVEAYQGMKKFRSASKVLNSNLPNNELVVQKLIAENYLGLGDIAKADELYQTLLNQNPQDDDALLGRATSQIRSAKVDESLAFLKRINPESKASIKANILVAGIQIKQEQLELAESTLSELLASMSNTDIIEPEKALVLERLAYVLTRQGRSNEAYIYTKLLSEAFPGSNEVKEKYQSAVEKLQSNELNASKAILLDLLNQYPSYTRATQLLGVISYLQDDNQAASKYLSDSVDPEVTNAMTTHIYAATNLKLNEPKKVLEILEPGIKESKVPATLALYGLAAISDKQFAKGEKALLRSLELDPDNVRVRLALAGFYRSGSNADTGKEWAQLEKSYDLNAKDKYVLKDIIGYYLRHQSVEKAKQFVAESLTQNPKDYATNLVAGYFSLSQKQIDKALDYFTVSSKMVAEGEDLLNALFAKGKAEITLQKMKNAQKTFSEIVRKFPESELGYKGLLSTYLINGDEEVGQRKLEGYAEKNAQIAPYLVLIQSAVARQDVKAAKLYHKKAKSLKTGDPSIERLGNAIRYVEAVSAMKQNNFTEARTIVASILSSEPDNLRLLSFLVDLELKAGKTHEAEKVLAQIEKLSPNHPVINLLKGEIASANKDYEGAKSYYLSAWKKSPSEVVGDKLYKILGVMKDKAAQNQHVNDWLSVLPNSPAATLYQAINYQQRGQRIKALEAYEKLLKVYPNNVMALNNLGWIYFEKNNDNALPMLKRAYELAPESPAVLDSYGWVLVKKGRVEEGLVHLKKANQIDPSIQEIANHLKEAEAL